MILGKLRRKFPIKTSHIYAFSKWLKDNSKLGRIIWALVFLLVGVFVSRDSKSSLEAVWKSLTVFVIFIAITLIIRRLIIIILKNTGSSNQFIMPGIYLVRDPVLNFFRLKIDSINSENFSFANIKSSLEVTELNLKCYSNGVWNTELGPKFVRNISHIDINNYSIMFAKEFPGDKNSSFTHILPVPELVWQNYLNGKIKDNIFPAEYITPTSSWEKFEKPFGLILFSVGSLKYQNIRQRWKKEYRKKLGDILEQAIAFHIHKHVSTYFDKGHIVPIILQNESKIYTDFLKDRYDTMSNESGDKATIIRFNVLVE